MIYWILINHRRVAHSVYHCPRPVIRHNWSCQKISTSDVDSGFNFSSSSRTQTTQASFHSSQSQTAASSQNTILVSIDLFNSTQCQSGENSQNHEIKHKWSDSQHIENEENYDEKMPLSAVTTTAEGEENHEQSQQFNDMPNTILPEIDPNRKLFSKIKSQYSDCVFVYALASNMCKDIYPNNSYISLKTALLLSIVSCNVSLEYLDLFIMSFEFYLFLQQIFILDTCSRQNIVIWLCIFL